MFQIINLKIFESWNASPYYFGGNEEINIINKQKAIIFANEGNYTVRVTNSIVAGLTIYTKVIALGVSSLQRDSLALVNLYQVTHGDQWSDKTGWDSSNRGKLNTWKGVVLGNNRIKGVILPNNNLVGIIPDKIRDITQLDTLDVPGNKLTSIPFVGTMDSLASFDVSHNQIGFENLIPNKAVPGFVYNPQDSLEGNLSDTIPVGSDLTLRAITRATGNAYSWFMNGTQINGATDSLYTIKSIQRSTDCGRSSREIERAGISGDIYIPLTVYSHRMFIFKIISTD